MLNDGGTAIYKSGSGTNLLTFTYTVGNAQNTSALAVTGNNLNGSTVAIQDASGNQADFSGADVNFRWPRHRRHGEFDLGQPVHGRSRAGEESCFFRDDERARQGEVLGSGTPYLVLGNGGKATYTSGSGTNLLTFTNTVGALGSGQNASALAVTGFNPNGATVYDSNIVADTADLSGVVSFAGGPQIDTTAPTVSSVATSENGIVNGNADLNAGKTVTLKITFSEKSRLRAHRHSSSTMAGPLPTRAARATTP